MRLTEKINEDLKTAMKAKDAKALDGIRAIKSAILLAQKDGSGQELTEELEIKLLQKLVKQRQESLEIYTTQNRPDLAEKESDEIEVISRYLPEQMSEEKITAILKKIIEKTGASSMKDMGKVMGMASKELAGKADGKTISGLVRKMLN